jgi:hypothetical protein
MKKRPVAVTFVAVLECAAAAMAGVVCFLLLVPGTRMDRMWELNPAGQAAFAGHTGYVATILLLVGALAAAAGVGLLRGQLWAWLLSVALFGINALGDVVSLLLTRDWFHGIAGIIIDAVFLYLLLGASVRAFFLRRT